MQIEAYLQPLQFRAFDSADFDRCLAIWRANEPQFFPAGYEPLFVKAMKEEDLGLYLLGEWEGEIVCCGGISYYGSRYVAYLSFGMVDPRHHRRGFGTTLLLARLSLLDPPAENCCSVSMEVTQHSFSFYRRFGFQCLNVQADEQGFRSGSFNRRVRRTDVDRCRAYLSRYGVAFQGDCQIPFGEPDQEILPEEEPPLPSHA